MLQTHTVITEPGQFFPSVKEDDKTDKGHPAVEGRFWRQGQPDIKRSLERDEVVHRKVVMVDRRLVGEQDQTTSKVDNGNFSEWITRFPEAWEDFLKRDSASNAGTPLSEALEDIDDSFQRALFIAGIRSVEDFIDASDALCESVGLGTKRIRNQLIEAYGSSKPEKKGSKK